MKKVIIGAGPAGLYTAIKLRQQGLIDLVVYDPRAGHYTRPGHLNPSVFTRAQEGLQLTFWPAYQHGHIKDLEKELYKQALTLGIKIEKKRFVSLYQDAKTPGVIVEHNGEEEIVHADYVFDCTGTQRRVVAAVNSLVPDSPLKLNTITDLPVRNHFLAYVKIKENWDIFSASQQIIDHFPETVNALSFAQSMVKLRALGWKEFVFPRCYGVTFGKDKVCLYLHAPEHLSEEHYDDWVQTVLNCYVDNISYEKLPPSPKPRFLPFTSSAEELQEVSFKGKSLPTVITLGDAQIDFDYYLAHGIEDGMKRIDALFEHFDLFDNEIYYFDSAEYLAEIHQLLKSHKKALCKQAEGLKQTFVKALETAVLQFKQAKQMSQSAAEKEIFSNFLTEIEARQRVNKARLIFAECHNESNQLLVTRETVDQVIIKLHLIQNDLLKAHHDLPALFAKEQQEIKELLLHMAFSWKEAGNLLFRSQNKSAAIDAYKNALRIYHLSDFKEKHSAQELAVYSNYVIVSLKTKSYSEAITAANTALSIVASCNEDKKINLLKEKIVFNLVKAQCKQAQTFLQSQKNHEAEQLHKEAEKTIDSHSKIISSGKLSELQALIHSLSQQLQSTNDPINRHSLQSESNGTERSVGSALEHLSVFRPPTSPERVATSATECFTRKTNS